MSDTDRPTPGPHDCEGCGHDRSAHRPFGYPCVVGDCTCVEFVRPT